MRVIYIKYAVVEISLKYYSVGVGFAVEGEWVGARCRWRTPKCKCASIEVDGDRVADSGYLYTELLGNNLGGLFTGCDNGATLWYIVD